MAKNNVAVFVGIHSNAPRKKESGTETATSLGNAEVAAVQEFGAEIKTKDGRTIIIPERSFVRASIAKNRKRYLQLNARAAKRILNETLTLERYLDALGTIAAKDMRKFATDLRDPPNAPSTIAKKKSSNPLVNLREMIKAITSVVASRDEFDKNTTIVNE